MKLLSFLFGFFVLMNGVTANNVANSLIQNSCKGASKYKESESDFYKFCIASIKENPESEKVKNMDELTVVGVKNALLNMTNVKGIVEKILKEKKYKRLSEKPLRNCLNFYSEGTVSLTKVLEKIKLRDYKEIYGIIGDALSVPRICEYEFNAENQQKSPVTKENQFLFEMIQISEYLVYNTYVKKP